MRAPARGLVGASAILGPNKLDVDREVAILKKRIDDELKNREFFAFDANHTDYFDRKNLFGEEVATAFPLAIVNVEEAGKCLALDRATACVFHLMRVMESGLRATAKPLHIPYAPSWESYLGTCTGGCGR